MRSPLSFGWAISLLLAFTVAAGAAEVTLCATDVQAPSGGNVMNLSTALQIGGHVTFKCGASATLLVTINHTIGIDTDIDGGDAMTLDGGGNRFGMFTGSRDTVRFGVSRLRVVNAGADPSLPGLGRIHGGFVGGRFSVVDLQSVSVEHSWLPVLLYGGALRVRGSSFANNDGPVLSASVIDVTDHSRFTNNRGSPIDGGTVMIDRSEFLSNTAPVRVTNGHLQVYGADFVNNAGSGGGGALLLFADATIEQTEFRNNTSGHGGAIFIGGAASTVTLRAVTFDGNVAKVAGGAIGLERSPTRLELIMTHVTFQDNRAGLGGAMTLDRDSIVNVVFNGAAVAFIRNAATVRGGAIYAPNATIQLNRGVFVGNTAGDAGGAIAALQQGDRSTALANSLVVRNTAPKGAAFWGNAATFVNTTIADNNGTAVWPAPVPFGPLPGSARAFPIRFVNSIVSGASVSCAPPVASSLYIDGGHNLQYPDRGCGPAIRVAFPFLGSYYVPLFWSPALNNGDRAVCDAPPILHKDLYGVRRPLAGPACAIGAVEGDIQHLLRRWPRPDTNASAARP